MEEDTKFSASGSETTVKQLWDPETKTCPSLGFVKPGKLRGDDEEGSDEGAETGSGS